MHLIDELSFRTILMNMSIQRMMKRLQVNQFHRKIQIVIQVVVTTKHLYIICLRSLIGSSDGGISSGRESWMSSQTNVYDQICYDAIQTNMENNLTAKYEDRSPPYTPSHLSDDAATEHYYYRLPTPSSINEIISSKPSRPQQTNSKKELHKELAHRQKM